MNGIISIIIPAFNRAHLIRETFDSIIAQTYKNWECLVVDDGSTDSTFEIATHYAKEDLRIKVFRRPKTKPKGANACRNIGLHHAQGEYIVFFDSDDLMTVNHLEVKIKAIEKFNCDYVITKTQYLNHNNDHINRYYQFDKFPITALNYVTQKINWLTYDICLKSSIAKSIDFNEALQSGQEYNYFCKLVHKTTNAHFIDEVVTLRRNHDHSIRSLLIHNNSRKESSFKAHWHTFLDLETCADKDLLINLMDKCVKISYSLKTVPVPSRILFIKKILKAYGFKGLYFIPMILGRRFSNRGYVFRQKLLKS